MKKSILFFLISSFMFYNFQCNDCEDELHDRSSYTAEISPLKTIYTLGDTILISTSFSSEIELESSGINHDNSNLAISFVVQIFEVQPNNGMITTGIENFQIRSNSGQISPSSYYEENLAIEIVTTCDDEKCEFQIEIIPNAKGIFCFSLLNSRFGEDECEYLSLIKNDFGLDNNNFEICQEINTSHFRLMERGAFYANPEDFTSFYFFKVE